MKKKKFRKVVLIVAIVVLIILISGLSLKKEEKPIVQTTTTTKATTTIITKKVVTSKTTIETNNLIPIETTTIKDELPTTTPLVEEIFLSEVPYTTTITEPLLIYNNSMPQTVIIEVHSIPITQKAENIIHIVSEDEYNNMCKIVQLEAGVNASDYHKQLVASVILRRSIDWQMSVADVMSQQGQFDTYGKYCEVTQSTRDAVDYVLGCEDVINIKYFYSVGNVPQSVANRFESLSFVQELEGHRFFN